jgi:hypothetical protein
MMYHVGIVKYLKGWIGNMAEISRESTAADVWLVMTIGDSSDEFSSRSMMFERICFSEDAAIELASSHKLAFVVKAIEVQAIIRRVSASMMDKTLQTHRSTSAQLIIEHADKNTNRSLFNSDDRALDRDRYSPSK